MKSSFAAAAAFGLLLGMAACGEALRLEPPSGSTTGPGSGGSGQGGGSPISCDSNSDCPAPTSVCDTAKSICVECLVFSDCGAQPGTVCSGGQCVCPTAGETWCEMGGCVDLTSDRDHCGQCERACFGSCVDSACADPWVPVSGFGSPSARSRHVAVWTGTHMIIWGGTPNGNPANNLNTGGMYDPATFEWTATNTVNAPSPRQRATAVWTGTQMIVWGGRDDSGLLNDGAIFDPATNSWTPMDQANAPAAREFHTAVWTEGLMPPVMVVWGGRDADELNSGGVYSLESGWTPTAALPTPAATRRNHSAVWTGTEMLIYGGIGDAASLMLTNTYFPATGVPGGRSYNPGANSWDIIPDTPPAVASHSAVWTGEAMLLYGGTNGTADLDSGFKFENDLWSAFSGNAPEARTGHTAVWLDGPGKMLVWGGTSATNGILNSGAVYDPGANNWEEMLPTVLEPRIDHTAVSTGTTMIVWGGSTDGSVPLNTGAIYTP